MKLITEVDISEFRGIKKCSEPIKLTKFNVIIGRNNSGKSAFLEAISLMPIPNRNYHLPYYKLNRTQLINSLHSSKSLVYGYSGTAKFRYNLLNKKIKVRLKSKHDIAELNINETDYDFETYLKILRDTYDSNKDEEINNSIFFIPNNTEIQRKLFENIRTEDIREAITKKGINKSIARDLINECVDDRYSEVLTDNELMRVRKELSNKNNLYIHLQDLGDGIKKAILMTLALEYYKPKLILWDDFGGSSHPKLITMLLKWLDKKYWQVVISTHSIDVLHSLLEVKPRGTQVLLFKKTQDDELITQSYNLDDFEDMMYSNTDPRLIVDSLEL